MIDFRTAKILGHRWNIQRYARLLAGELTELERQYLHKRIAEEHAELERLQESPPQQPGILIAPVRVASEPASATTSQRGSWRKAGTRTVRP
jgi:hypothetical protein